MFNRPLFVHPKASFLDRVSKESEGSALTARSVGEALKLVSPGVHCLSSAFVSPSDYGASTFKLLERLIEVYPATPLFLIAPDEESDSELTFQLIQNLPIQGVFSEQEPIQGYLSFLREGDLFPAKRNFDSLKPVSEYQAVPMSDFFSASHFHFDVYSLNHDRDLSLLWPASTVIEHKLMHQVAEQNQALYIKKAEIEGLLESLRRIALEPDSLALPLKWHTSEVISNLKEVLSLAKQAGVKSDLIEKSKSSILDSLMLVNRIEVDQASFSQLIRQAERSHRSIFCLFFSILICRKLKFEKTATVEILGVASLLQDISLYQTPFGDLSELSVPDELTHEQLKFYLQHPNHSANLLAKHSEISEVTLQVIRQAHERKDRSGFPNRVGGNHLHPMAEILSLVNAYYEIQRVSSDIATTVKVLQETAFQNGSPRIVDAFKLVLGGIIREERLGST